jgi:hypothetical protein
MKEKNMARYPGWLPGPRTFILEMCRVWISYMDSAKRTAWGIPAAEFTALGDLYGDAQEALQKAMDEAERTHVITVVCKKAFEALIKKMRFFRDRYFKLPPLTDEDWAALGFREKNPHHTPTGTPTAQVEAETYLTGLHELGIRINYLAGDPDDRANKGFRVWYKLVEPGGAPVTDPAELTESFFTQRKKDVITFAYTDSGKTVYIAVQIENGKKKGPWGRITSALVP